MENAGTPAGENETILAGICRRMNAQVDFKTDSGTGLVVAVLSGLPSVSSAAVAGYEIASSPKATREDACLSVIRQLLFSDVSDVVGVPHAASAEELKLKLEVIGPS